jgi:hypothetical protein
VTLHFMSDKELTRLEILASKTEIDCARQRHRDVHVVTYNCSGNSVTTTAEVGEWEVVVPDTFAVRLLDLVCRGEAKDVLARQGTFLDVAHAAREALEGRSRPK